MAQSGISATRNVTSPANAAFCRPVGFSVEYFDPVAKSLKSFVLTYFPDGKVQMVCDKTGKVFLSKIYSKEITPKDLYIGNTVVVFSRELSIVEYADESTRKLFEKNQARGFVVVLAGAMSNLGEIIRAVQNGEQCGGGEKCPGQSPVRIANAEMFQLEGRQLPPHLAMLEDALPQSGVVVALELLTESRNGGFSRLLDTVDRLRQRHGGDVFASGTPVEAAEHAHYVFRERGLMPTARVADLQGQGAIAKECTLCVVKPHVVRDGELGAVLSFVSNRGFQVAAMRMMFVGEVEAEELLLPYRGVICYHADAVRQLKSGPCVVLQIEGGSGVVEEFREACGPADPEVARALYPHSIRALLGVQQATNGVHCTDLPEDGLLECQYMFRVVGRH